MEQRKIGEEFFGFGILEQMSRSIPSCSFEEHAVDVAACRRFLSDVSVTLGVDDIVSKGDLRGGRREIMRCFVKVNSNNKWVFKLFLPYRWR